jgi:predicted negative regulator of RcsB-dependent stress response
MGAQMQILVAICGVILSIGSVIGLIWKWMLPHIKDEIRKENEQYDADLAELQAKVSELELCSQKDYAAIQRHGAVDQAMMSALFALLEHAETTNGKGLMAAAKSELQKHLINHM